VYGVGAVLIGWTVLVSQMPIGYVPQPARNPRLPLTEAGEIGISERQAMVGQHLSKLMCENSTQIEPLT
jgi:hypothetical protein